MTSAELREVLSKEPFRPFRLRFGSGRAIEIINPGLVAVSSTGRTAFAYRPRGDGWDIFDIFLIEAIEFIESNGNGRKGRKKR